MLTHWSYVFLALTHRNKVIIHSQCHTADNMALCVAMASATMVVTYLILPCVLAYRVLFQYPIRPLIVISCKVSEAVRFVFRIVRNSIEIWQAPRQQCCRCAYQRSKRYDNLNYQSHGFETSRDFTIRRLIGYWNGALVAMPLTAGDGGRDEETSTSSKIIITIYWKHKFGFRMAPVFRCHDFYQEPKRYFFKWNDIKYKSWIWDKLLHCTKSVQNSF